MAEQPPRKRRFKRWLLTFLALFVAAFAMLNILAYRHAYTMTHFIPGVPGTHPLFMLSWDEKLGVLLSGVKLGRPGTATALATLGPLWRSETITCPNGLKLGAWFCPGARTNEVVILFHGYAGEKSGLVGEANAFLEMGLSVLLVDFRGSGESSESYTTIGYREGEDVAAAAKYAREHLAARRVVLYGISMGAAAVLRAVNSNNTQPDAIILEAVFDRMLTTVQNRFTLMGLPAFPAAQLMVFWGGWQAGFNGFRHNPMDYAASVKCPILFLHGTNDTRARLREARRVFDSITSPKTFKEFAGMDHEAGFHSHPDEWEEAVSRFLKTTATVK